MFLLNSFSSLNPLHSTRQSTVIFHASIKFFSLLSLDLFSVFFSILYSIFYLPLQIEASASNKILEKEKKKTNYFLIMTFV